MTDGRGKEFQLFVVVDLSDTVFRTLKNIWKKTNSLQIKYNLKVKRSDLFLEDAKREQKNSLNINQESHKKIKTGHNKSCHCGSGKKYKKCHLNKDA
jgi:uncharacterized protein YchJ